MSTFSEIVHRHHEAPRASVPPQEQVETPKNHKRAVKVGAWVTAVATVGGIGAWLGLGHDSAPTTSQQGPLLVDTGSANPNKKAAENGTADASATPLKAHPSTTATVAPHETKAPTAENGNLMHADLTGLSSQEVYPLPENMQPDYIYEHPDQIPEIFKMNGKTADGKIKTPQEIIKEVTDRDNAIYRLGDAEKAAEDALTGKDVYKSLEDDSLAAWQAMYGYNKEATPPQDVLEGWKKSIYSQVAVNMTLKNPQPNSPKFQPSDNVYISDIEHAQITTNPDGTWSAKVPVRNVEFVDNNAVHQADQTLTFTNYDTISTSTFTNWGVDKATGKILFERKDG